MRIFGPSLRNLEILLFTLLLTILLVNVFGKKVEYAEANLYLKISGKKSQYIDYDALGIPVIVFEGNLGTQYSSVTVAEQAIKLSDQSDSISKSSFHKCIDWLVHSSQDLNDSSIIFLDYYNWQGYQMESPWRSAMNQGRSMQAFLLAFRITGDSSYLELASRSMNTLYTEVKHGGVTYIESDGYWYEEYADDNAPQSRVLNGMIVVLQALSDYYKATGDPSADFLFKKGVASVKNALPIYDNEGHSNYDILGKPAKAWYHNFHIELLGFLYEETGDKIFDEYRQKWMAYKEPAYLIALLKKPTNIGIFTVFSIFASVFIILYASFYFTIKKKVEKVEKV